MRGIISFRETGVGSRPDMKTPKSLETKEPTTEEMASRGRKVTPVYS